jgi:hypothetical protein
VQDVRLDHDLCDKKFLDTVPRDLVVRAGSLSPTVWSLSTPDRYATSVAAPGVPAAAGRTGVSPAAALAAPNAKRVRRRIALPGYLAAG